MLRENKMETNDENRLNGIRKSIDLNFDGIYGHGRAAEGMYRHTCTLVDGLINHEGYPLREDTVRRIYRASSLPVVEPLASGSEAKREIEFLHETLVYQTGGLPNEDLETLEEILTISRTEDGVGALSSHYTMGISGVATNSFWLNLSQLMPVLEIKRRRDERRREAERFREDRIPNDKENWPGSENRCE